MLEITAIEQETIYSKTLHNLVYEAAKRLLITWLPIQNEVEILPRYYLQGLQRFEILLTPNQIISVLVELGVVQHPSEIFL